MDTAYPTNTMRNPITRWLAALVNRLPERPALAVLAVLPFEVTLESIDQLRAITARRPVTLHPYRKATP
jgi:hypothetical protein